MTELKRQLEWIAALGQSEEMRGVGAQERFVLKHGHEFTDIIDIPEHVERGPMKMCFGNAALMAMAFPDEFIYTEGYAWQHGIPITLAHGWLTNRQGQVIDPTWGVDKEVDYYGVLVKHEYIRPRAGLSMIDDWQNGWPLITSEAPEIHLVKLEDWISGLRPRSLIKPRFLEHRG